MFGFLGAILGVVGLSALFGSALMRLFPYVFELKDLSLQWFEWVALVLCLIVMGYAEGYKGFHLRFSPRAAARALYLSKNPTWVRVIFAPLFCMGYFHATRKRKIVSYGVTGMIILLIIGVRHLSQPWRGIVDAGVVFGLGWGVVSVWWFAFKAFFRPGFNVSPEVGE